MGAETRAVAIAEQPPQSLPPAAADSHPIDAASPPKAMRAVDLTAPPTPLVDASKEPTKVPTSFRTKSRETAASKSPRSAAAKVDSETARHGLGGSALTNSAVSTVDPRGFAMVKVFYATNRQAKQSSAFDAKALLDEFMLPAILALVTAALFALRYFGVRSRALAVAMVLVAVVTFGWSLWAGYHTLKLVDAASRPGQHYGNERGLLEMGVCEVSIPPEHKVGELESTSIWRLEFRKDESKHVVLRNATQMEPDTYFSELKQRVSGSPRRDAFVFVHGFNVSFENAARRTAQIAYDLNFEGAPIFFSWPSQAGPLQYTVDKENSEWAASDIKDFLKELAQRGGAEQIHLVAHSMGNRALTYALRALASEIQQPLFNEVVLTAPDIDAQIFKRDLAPAIVRTAKRVTMYASSHDHALKLSKEINGYPRAGDSGSGLVVVSGVDTIDVSAIDKDLLGHSYYGSNDTVLGDLLELIKKSKGPDLRDCLAPRSWTDGLKYWVFEPKTVAAKSNKVTR
jgi:esterase/lipase superfamily enzyme